MSMYTPPSELILRHQNLWQNRAIFFAGDLQDNLSAQLQARARSAQTSQYHHWRRLQPLLNEKVFFNLTADHLMLQSSNTLIYYWPKNKPEAQFQLQNILSLLPLGSDIFVVGENRSGVRSAQDILSPWLTLSKIDSARRCSLYHGCLKKIPAFDLENFWGEYHHQNAVIKTLPGVFSRQGIDVGTALLASTFSRPIKGKVLDMGCGAGALPILLAPYLFEAQLFLSDVNAAALKASAATLTANGLTAKIFASDVFSDVNAKFDVILSNPAFHDGTQKNLNMGQYLIKQACEHLTTGGELRLVANAFLPYAALLDAAFGKHDILIKNGRFVVYRAIKS